MDLFVAAEYRFSNRCSIFDKAVNSTGLDNTETDPQFATLNTCGGKGAVRVGQTTCSLR